MSPQHRIWLIALFVMTSCLLAGSVPAAESTLQTDARSVGLQGDGKTDDTDALQKALDDGACDIYFPEGTYLLGTVKVPADTRLRFSPRAAVRVNVPRLAAVQTLMTQKQEKYLFIVTGDNVTIDGLAIDFRLSDEGDQLIARDAMHAFIYGVGINNLKVTNARAEKPERRELIPLAERKRNGRYRGRTGHTLVFVEDCTDVTLSDSRASSIDHMINALMCRNVSVHGNRMVTGESMTTFSMGGEFLRHYDNWSSDVGYQVVWRGGSPDPSRKAPAVPLGSSTVVHRGSRPGDPNYNRHTSGVFDVIVQNNYAEYGKTLAWGNKSRQVVIANNIARYIADYAYGTEGAENVVFSGNISINSTAASFVSMYWGEKIQITGNTAIVRHDNWDPNLSWWPTEKQYHGGFVRLHHGPTTKEDTAAGSRYGAGQVTISGNLFVNELTGIPKAINIQPGRDVTITGNRFTNGMIRKWGPGSLTVSDNEFVWDFAEEFFCIHVRHTDGNVTITNNTMRRIPRDNTVADPADVADTGPGLAATEEDTNEFRIEPGTVGAINVNWKQPLQLVISGNTIDGWSKSVTLNCDGAAPARLLMINNAITGSVTATGRWRTLLRNNVDLTRLEVVDQIEATADR